MHAYEKVAWRTRLFASASALALCCAFPYPADASPLDIVSTPRIDPKIVAVPRVSTQPVAIKSKIKKVPHNKGDKVAKKVKLKPPSAANIARRPIKDPVKSPYKSPLEIAWSDKEHALPSVAAATAALAVKLTAMPQISSPKAMVVVTDNEIAVPAAKKEQPQQVAKATLPTKKPNRSPLEIIAALEQAAKENNGHKAAFSVPAKTELALIAPAAGKAQEATVLPPQKPSAPMIAALPKDQHDDDVLRLTPPKSFKMTKAPIDAVAVANQTTLAEMYLASNESTEPLWKAIDEQVLAVAALEPAAGEPAELMAPATPAESPTAAEEAPKLSLPEPLAAAAPAPAIVQPAVVPDSPVLTTPALVAPSPAEKIIPLSPIEKAQPALALPEATSAPVVAKEDVKPLTENAKPTLSAESRKVLDNLPPEIGGNGRDKSDVKLERSHKGKSEDSVKKHEAYGMKITVKRPKVDVFRMLESAYNSLIAGDQQYAITLYKEVLDEEPENTLALFGLATTYHRAGQTQLARPLYAKLLDIDPHNVEGLNNFLVLLSDESPEEALVELEKLRRSHPSFSPVLAQMALIYERQGEYSIAAEKLAQACAISPENLKYQYNMAIVLDKMKDWEGASNWYQKLITASERGEKIPGNAQEIQQRLTFIRSNTSSVN